jgi:hypothetical protein
MKYPPTPSVGFVDDGDLWFRLNMKHSPTASVGFLLLCKLNPDTSARLSSLRLHTAKCHAGARGSCNKITFIICYVAFHHADGTALFDYASCCAKMTIPKRLQEINLEL